MPKSLRILLLLSGAAMVLATSLAAPGCAHGEKRRSLEVTATAYNSVPGQTQGNPTETAWGDRLKPGMKAIAVSRDLIALGLGHGVEVEIEGLPGTYTVRDKVHRRWTRRIDIYMGKDVQAAREWGKRTVTIHWEGSEEKTRAREDGKR